MYALSHQNGLNCLAVHRMTCLTMCGGFDASCVLDAFARFTWLDEMQIQQQCLSPLWAMDREATKLPPPTRGHNSSQRQAALNYRHTPAGCTQMWSFRSLSIAHGLACSGMQQHGAVCGACSAAKTTQQVRPTQLSCSARKSHMLRRSCIHPHARSGHH